MPTTLRLCAVLTAGLGLLAGVFACSSGEPAATPDPSSTRKLGTAELTGITGAYQNHAWLGVRYAKAPKGALRFRAPQLLEPGAGSKQRAIALGAPCPQLAHPFGVDDEDRGTPVGDEDCLFLNVYAPKLAPAQVAGAKLPVMLWIHGGGNSVGHGGGYDGGNLAQRERVIVITTNYRLGPLGWFRHAALREGASPEDASGNYGTLDLIAALRWVQKHAAAFGGDPGNVTIFGESAGARDVMALLIAPQARGLFHRAIAQSGNVRTQDARKAEVFAAQGGHRNSSSEVLARLLVKDGKAKDAAGGRAALAQMKPAEIAAYVRAKTPPELLAAYATEREEGLPDVPNSIAEGHVIPNQPVLTRFASIDGWHRVPVMLGTNRDESKTFMLYDPEHVKRFTPLYMRLRDPDRYNAQAQAMSLAWKVAGADAPAAAIAASGGEAYVYRFDWDEQPVLFGADLSVMLGAGHGIEIPFVFGHFDLGAQANRMFTDETKPTREKLAHRMMWHWAEFARSGKPGSEWKAYRADPGEQYFMVFDSEQGGGMRLEPGALNMQGVLASIEQDARLRSESERCAVLREVVRSSPLLDLSVYPTLAGGACKSYPLTASR